jgi:uncharacterized protein
MDDWRAIVERLDMQPHPEGGWYAERWRAPADGGERPAGSAILFLLAAGQHSHWHRVDAAEVWQWSAGAALELRVANSDGGSVVVHRLGGDVLHGASPQVVVPAGAWQAAASLGDWTLVGCIVAPAFNFEGFELAPDGWEPGSGQNG